MKNTRSFITILILFLSPASALACLWDHDTLKMERQKFPDTLELITGKFLRHSQDFYHWRIKDRLEKLRKYPSKLELYDDLGVAYDKTGQHQLAIDTMLKKDKLKPGLYKTEANLGTFYIHSGQLEKGLKHIHQAIEINPEAHFGREKYQAYLVEWVLSRSKDGKPDLPLTDIKLGSFADFLVTNKNIPAHTHGPERKAALKGVLGMMKFGHYDHPILLEALASLLAGPFGGGSEDAKQLAARAFLKASYEVKKDSQKQKYRTLATEVLQMQTQGRNNTRLTLNELESQFKNELKEAETWYQQLEANEKRWIKEGKDPEKEFDRHYYKKPQVSFGGFKSSEISYVAIGRTVGCVVLLLMNLYLMFIIGVILTRRTIVKFRKS